MEQRLGKIGFEQSAINMLGKESVFGKKSLRRLENKIFRLTGSKVKFSASNNNLPNEIELNIAKRSGESLMFIPDTMTIIEQRGIELDEPSTVSITIERLFELFYSKTELQTIFRMRNDSVKEMTVKLLPFKPTPKALVGREERSKTINKKFDEVTKKFEGGVLNLGGLLEILANTDYNFDIQGGWRAIKKYVNNELIDPESLVGEMGTRIPSLIELFMIQLISSVNNQSDEQPWFPTNSMTEVSVTEPNLDPNRTMHNHILTSKVRGRYYVTYDVKRGVGVVALRDDIAQYKKHIMSIR